MLGFLKDHSGAFDPEEVRIQVAAFEKAWASVQASGAIFVTDAKAETARRYSRSILLRPLSKASVTRVGYAMALWWRWLNQICEAWVNKPLERRVSHHPVIRDIRIHDFRFIARLNPSRVHFLDRLGERRRGPRQRRECRPNRSSGLWSHPVPTRPA
jgi:hypothetical protein